MTFVIDGTADGLFTAVFNAFLIKKLDAVVTDGSVQLEIDNDVVDVLTNKDKADRVFKKLQAILPHNELNKIFTALKSGDNAKYSICFDYIVFTVSKNKDVSRMFSEPKVFRFDALVHKVTYEAHRFKGFIRFSRLDNGVYYAKFNPDNDITSLIVKHFEDRFKGQPFILHDLTNNVITACYNGNRKTVYKKIDPLSCTDEFAKLFKTYYDSVFIKERKNHKTMYNFMPRRYHKNMPEKNELL